MKNQRTKGKCIAQSILSLIAALLVTLLCVAAFSTELKYLFGKPTNINDMLAENGAPEKGEYVSVGVDAVFDWYAETNYKINGVIPAGSKQHCIMWLDDDSIISLTVKGKKNIEKIDNIIEGTESYLNGTSDRLPSRIIFEGKVTELGSEVKQYYNDVVLGSGYTIHYLTIDTTYSKTSIIIYGLIFLLIIGGLIASFISGIRGVKKLKEAESAAAGLSQSYRGQGYNGQGYNMQGYNGQDYNAQTYNGQGYNGQDYNGQNYNG